MRRMMNGEGCLQIPKEFLAVAGLNRETDVLIGMAPEVILITSKNLDETKREKIRDALRSFSVDLDIPLLPEGVLLPKKCCWMRDCPAIRSCWICIWKMAGLSLKSWRILRRSCWRRPGMKPRKMMFSLSFPQGFLICLGA